MLAFHQMLGNNADDPTFQKIVEKLPNRQRDLIEEALDARVDVTAKNEAHDQKRRALLDKKREINVAIALLKRDKESGHYHGHGETFKSRIAGHEKELNRVIKKLEAFDVAPPLSPVPPAERPFYRARNSWIPTLTEFFNDAGPRARYEERRAETKGFTLAKARKAQDECVARFVELEKAPLSTDEAIQAMRAEVRKAAAAGAPDIAGLLNYRQLRASDARKRQGAIRWPAQRLTHVVNGETASIFSAEVELGTSFAVWLHREEIEQRLEAMIRERLGDRDGVSARDRDKEAAQLRERFLELQRVEARLLHEAGDDADWRPLHPLALLELVRVQDAPLIEREDAGGRDGGQNTPATQGTDFSNVEDQRLVPKSMRKESKT